MNDAPELHSDYILSSIDEDTTTKMYFVRDLTAAIATDDKKDGCRFDVTPPADLGLVFVDVPDGHIVQVAHRYEFYITYPEFLNNVLVTLILHSNETVDVQVEGIGKYE